MTCAKYPSPSFSQRGRSGDDDEKKDKNRMMSPWLAALLVTLGVIFFVLLCLGLWYLFSASAITADVPGSDSSQGYDQDTADASPTADTGGGGLATQLGNFQGRPSADTGGGSDLAFQTGRFQGGGGDLASQTGGFQDGGGDLASQTGEFQGGGGDLAFQTGGFQGRSFADTGGGGGNLVQKSDISQISMAQRAIPDTDKIIELIAQRSKSDHPGRYTKEVTELLNKYLDVHLTSKNASTLYLKIQDPLKNAPSLITESDLKGIFRDMLHIKKLDANVMFE